MGAKKFFLNFAGIEPEGIRGCHAPYLCRRSFTLKMAPDQVVSFLSIAGTDPSGGAGLLADVKVASARGLYAMGVVTAVTAQNTRGVAGFTAVDPSLLESQLECVFSDIPPAAVKIGMLPTVESIETVARVLEKYRPAHVVLDPVLVSTSGHSLSGGETRQALLSRLAPLCHLITPNIPEALALTGLEKIEAADMQQAAAALLERSGCPAVLLKGGHAYYTEEAATMTDLYADARGKVIKLLHPRIDTPNTHGTGCTLSTLIACRLASGLPMERAVAQGVEQLQELLRAGASTRLGHGHGPAAIFPSKVK